MKTSVLLPLIRALFGISNMNIPELSKSLSNDLNTLSNIDPNDVAVIEKYQHDFGKNIREVDIILQSQESEAISQIAQEFYNIKLFDSIVLNLPKILDEEIREVISSVFEKLLKRQIGARAPTIDYFLNRKEILLTLLKGYEDPKVALIEGSLLRECLKYEPLAKIVLLAPAMYDLFTYMKNTDLPIALDAFSTFKELFTRHKVLVAEFLDKNRDMMVTEFHSLIACDRRQIQVSSLELLGSVLLDRHNFNFMIDYVGNINNLKVILDLIKNDDKDVQLAAFAVLKVFIANPLIPQDMKDYLKSQDLVPFLSSFQTDNTKELFQDEKTYIIDKLNSF